MSLHIGKRDIGGYGYVINVQERCRADCVHVCTDQHCEDPSPLYPCARELPFLSSAVSHSEGGRDRLFKIALSLSALTPRNLRFFTRDLVKRKAF